MKQQQTILAAAVMAALLAPVYGGGVLAAEQFPTASETITEDKTYETAGTVQADITGSGTQTVSINNSDSQTTGVVLVNSGKNITFSNLKELNVSTSKSGLDGIQASGGATINLSNIDTVNVGTKEDPFLGTNAQTIHGLSGIVKMENIGELNIYSNGQGIMAQRNNLNDETAAATTPSVDVTTTGDINIQTKSISVMAASMNDHKGIAGVALKAGGMLSVTSQENVALSTFDRNANPVYEGDGAISAVLQGKKGVNITSEKSIGMYFVRKSSADATVKVQSDEGDVTITGATNAIQIKPDAKDPTDAAKEDTKIDVNIVGRNVLIKANGTEANGTYVNNGKLSIASNQDGGVVSIQAASGVVAKVEGNNGTLTVGDGTHSTNFLSNGQIQIDNGGSVTVKDNTTTIVDAAALGKNALVSVTNGGKFTAESGAKLKVSGAYTGKSLYFKDNANSNVSFWSNTNTSFDNPFQYLDADGTVRAGVTEANASSLAGYIVPAVAIAVTNANDSAITPLITAGADSYNAAVGIGQAGGIQHSTYAVTGLVADALDTHEDTPEKDIWAKGFHSTEDIDNLGFAGGALNLDTQYNGAIVGADLYQKEGTAAGIAVSYAAGSISGTNGAVYTKNDAEYLGVSLYGRKDLGSYRLAADLSYLGGSHDLTQYNNGTTVTAEPNTEAWSLGVKALRDYDFGSGTLTPYVGARYLRLTTDQYTSSLGLPYDKETQNLFLLPVGADYSLNLNRGSWNIKPYAGIGYIWTVGDRSADQTVSYGTEADTFAYDVTDAGSFLAKAGISAEHGDYSFGVGYAYQKGSTVDSDTWTVQAAYKF